MFNKERKSSVIDGDALFLRFKRLQEEVLVYTSSEKKPKLVLQTGKCAVGTWNLEKSLGLESCAFELQNCSNNN